MCVVVRACVFTLPELCFFTNKLDFFFGGGGSLLPPPRICNAHNPVYLIVKWKQPSNPVLYPQRREFRISAMVHILEGAQKWVRTYESESGNLIC